MIISKKIAAAAAILAAAAMIVYFATFRHSVQESGIAAQAGRETPQQAAADYFRSFQEANADIYISLMPEEKLFRQRRLFDSDEGMYESYRAQFEDEREFFSAVYGADYLISFEITSQEEYESGARLYISAEVCGLKKSGEYDGVLTLSVTKDGWYVNESDFEEAFW